MAINKNVGGKKAGAGKKANFFKCDGCSRTFTAGTGVTAPTNRNNMRYVCKNCYNKHFGSFTPVPSVASVVLKQLYGSFMTFGGARILSNANGGLISDKSGGILSNANGGIISDKGSGLISNNRGSILGENGLGLVGQDGGSLIGNKGSMLIGDAGATFKRG